MLEFAKRKELLLLRSILWLSIWCKIQQLTFSFTFFYFHSPFFIFIHLFLFSFTFFYFHSPFFILIHLFLFSFIFFYFHSPFLFSFTFFYFHSPSFIFIHLFLFSFIFFYFHSPIPYFHSPIPNFYPIILFFNIHLNFLHARKKISIHKVQNFHSQRLKFLFSYYFGLVYKIDILQKYTIVFRLNYFILF